MHRQAPNRASRFAPSAVRAFLALALLSLLLLVACGGNVSRPEKTVFVQGLSAAEIEARHPLSLEARAELTPENVETLAQWEVDQLYARLTAGAIPDGPYRGRFFFAEGGGPRKLSEALGGLGGKVVDFKLAKLEGVGEALWKGKVFFKSEGVLRNMIEHEDIVREIFGADPASIRKTRVGGREVALLFPAHLYCGESLYDSRRESVIIDYADSASIDGYIPEIDAVASRDGLGIRDEIRLVRPGFYLGRAYAGSKMLLTFTLYNDAVAEAGVPVPEECRSGGG